MKHLTRLMLAAAAMFALATNSQADDFSDVRETIQKYLDGTSQGKLALLSEAFLPSAEIQWIRPDGTFGRRTSGEYIALFTEGRQVERLGRIVKMEIAGTAASATVEIFMGSNDRVYTDYMLLLKVGDEWRISNKVASSRDKY